MEMPGDRLKEARKRRGFETATEAAEAFGWNENTYRSHENGTRDLTWKAAQKYALKLRTSAVWLMTGQAADATNASDIREQVRSNVTQLKDVAGRQKSDHATPKAEEIERVYELDVRAGLGGGGVSPYEFNVTDEDGNTINADIVSGQWAFPVGYMARELRVQPRHVKIIEVEGDSMSPTLESGDRVMVDTSRQVPTPPGIFALWDGLGVIIKRIEYRGDMEPPSVEIISDNPSHQRRTMGADQVQILGRVVWRASRL